MPRTRNNAPPRARAFQVRPGGLYVLVGPRTFSAAQNCANRLERETFATFVGEPTGGAPNHYGDAALFTGEITGISAAVLARLSALDPCAAVDEID